MPLYGGFDEKDGFEDAAAQRLAEAVRTAREISVADTLGLVTGRGIEESTRQRARQPGRAESFAMAFAALHHEAGIPYAGEPSARVMPHPMPDGHRNLPA